MQKREKALVQRAEKLRKKHHEILDKHGYVEGRKIIAKRYPIDQSKSSMLSKIRRKIVGY